jgi:hypothetical protein
MKIGIVGSGDDKFTEEGKSRARVLIHLLCKATTTDTIVSGHSPVGGIDIWAEEIALSHNKKLDLKIPKQHTWNAQYGYKQRNLDIAKDSDEVHVIVVDKYPEHYKGMRFKLCYHCKTDTHIKSGGCWTGIQAQKLGKKVYWHIIKND